MQRILLVLGLALLAAAALWPWLAKLPFGRLPGDFAWERDGVRVYFPLATMLIASAVASLVLWLLRR